MRTTILLSIFSISSIHLLAQSDEDAVRSTLQEYIEGTSYSNPEQIKGTFYVDANLFLSKKDQEIFIMSATEYADSFEKKGAREIQRQDWKKSFPSTWKTILPWQRRKF